MSIRERSGTTCRECITALVARAVAICIVATGMWGCAGKCRHVGPQSAVLSHQGELRAVHAYQLFRPSPLLLNLKGTSDYGVTSTLPPGDDSLERGRPSCRSMVKAEVHAVVYTHADARRDRTKHHRPRKGSSIVAKRAALDHPDVLRILSVRPLRLARLSEDAATWSSMNAIPDMGSLNTRAISHKVFFLSDNDLAKHVALAWVFDDRELSWRSLDVPDRVSVRTYMQCFDHE